MAIGKRNPALPGGAGLPTTTLNIGLFKMTWENPSPELAVRSIDFLSKDLFAAPFLVDITVE